MPSPYRYLLEETDSRGYKRLVESTDGTRLLNDIDCDDCGCGSGDCATMRRWDRCPIPADQLACVNQPGFLWLCEPRQCFGGGLRYLNACYTPTDNVVPRASVPAADTVVLWADVTCSEGCTPDCTQCQRYYRADLCPGHNGQGPPLFVRVENVTGCGLVASSLVVPPKCYTVRPGGQVYTRAQILASGPGAIIDDQASAQVGQDCCDCQILPCQRNTVGPYTDCQTGQPFNLLCCCPNDYCITVNYAFRQTLIQGEGYDANGVPIVGAIQRVDLTGSGNFTACISAGVVTGLKLVKLKRHITEVPLPGNLPTDDEFYELNVLGPLNAGCHVFPQDFPVPTNAQGFIDGAGPICPWQLSPTPNFQLLFASRTYTCKRAQFKGHWKLFDPVRNPNGQPRIETIVEATYTVLNGAGPCAGNCAGTVVPVPSPLQAGAPVDNNVAKLLARQMVLGGCLGCGPG